MIRICRISSGFRAESGRLGGVMEVVERSISPRGKPAACTKIERLVVKAKLAATAVATAPVLLYEFITHSH
jgi:hypothetical protein